MNKISSILAYMAVLIQLFGCTQNSKNSTTNFDTAIVQEIKNHVKKEEAAGFKGVVMVSKNDSILFATSVGGEDYSMYHAFYIASITKQFTAAAIVQLYEDGLLSLDDTLGKFFEKVPDDKGKITVHHLLTHTSGLPDNYVADGILDRQEAVKVILAEPLKNEVGKEFSYSAEGYNLLSIIVEIVTGKGFEEFMKDNIISPLGLKYTGFWGQEDEHVHFTPYNNIKKVNELSENVYNQGKGITNYGYKGSTGMYSTIGDLYQWTKSLKRNKYLSEKSTQLLFRPYSVVRGDSINGTYYGYGWFIQLARGIKKEIRHGGSEEGLHNGIVRWTNNGYAIIVLSNQWADNVEGKYKGVEWSTVLSIGIRDIIIKRE